jgi:hypothetical protein
MSDVSQILSRIEQGDPSAAEQLLGVGYRLGLTLDLNHLEQERPKIAELLRDHAKNAE